MKTTSLVKRFTVKLISRTISQMIQKFRKLHTVRAQYGKTRNSLSLKEFRQINYLVIFWVKPLVSRNFYEKSVRENFCNFHTVPLSKPIKMIRNEIEMVLPKSWFHEIFQVLLRYQTLEVMFLVTFSIVTFISRSFILWLEYYRNKNEFKSQPDDANGSQL